MRRIQVLVIFLFVFVVVFASAGKGSAQEGVQEAAVSGWSAQYFANPNLAGSPAATRTDSVIHFEWGTGSPDPAIPPDNFSARWTGTVNLDRAGLWRFQTTTDDGVRLWIDGVLRIDQWHDQSATAYDVDVSLGAGNHSVKMEYYEHLVNAVAHLRWWPLSGNPYPDWKGEYFVGTTPDGTPTFTRNDPAINFDWGTDSPAPGFPADNFSVRWTRKINLDAGTYRFTITTDDGMRVWLDSALILNEWRDQVPATFYADRAVAAGTHTLRVEYYEHLGGATARMSWQRIGGTFPDWKGEYFSGTTPGGNPVLVRNDPAINFDWGTASPDPSVPPDNFSARWTRQANFSAGTYRFTAITDDGMRVWLDNALIIDAWRDQAPTTYTADRTLVAGAHNLRVEYYEHYGGATAHLSWQPINITFPDWKGEYFTGTTLSGKPVVVRNDPALDFNWGTSSPDPSIPPDNFSARWTRTFNFATSGTYVFTATADDGIRVWVDNARLIDAWRDQAPTTYTASVYLYAGVHSLRVEYYEHLGGAVARVYWNLGTTPTEVIVDDLSGGFTRGGTGWNEARIGYADHMFWVWNQSAYDAHWGRWTPVLPRAGNYEVFVFIPSNYAGATNARYQIYHARTWNTRAVNQAIYWSAWVSLGTYNFTADGSEYVYLGDATSEPAGTHHVGYDAVKFVVR
jgi:hypothetical protein